MFSFVGIDAPFKKDAKGHAKNTIFKKDTRGYAKNGKNKSRPISTTKDDIEDLDIFIICDPNSKKNIQEQHQQQKQKEQQQQQQQQQQQKEQQQQQQHDREEEDDEEYSPSFWECG